MKFILFVEGHTENKAIPSFLKQWLDPKLSKPVGIKSVRFEGWPELVKDSPTKANLYLSQDSVIAVIALLDLYGPTIYPDNENTLFWHDFCPKPIWIYYAILINNLCHIFPKTVVLVGKQFLCQNKPKSIEMIAVQVLRPRRS